MADINQLAPIIRKWEGGYVNDPADHGGSTNMGVTLETWKKVGYDEDGDGDIDAQDIKLLKPSDFTKVLKIYWDRWKADNIRNQSIANILVDWVWGSGSWGIKIPQRVLATKEDGVVGATTLALINGQDPKTLFDKIYNARVQFLQNIVKNNPSQQKFLKGWLNRLADFKFQ